MKKTFLALTLLGAFAHAAQAQSSVAVYGVLDVNAVYVNKALLPGTTTGATGSKVTLDSGDVSGSRLGFKGTEDLAGSLKALFQLEMGYKVDTGALDGTNNGVANTNTLFRRLSVVGLSGNFGSVLLGRQTDLAYQFSPWTSVGDFGGITSAVGHGLDRTEGARTNNSIRYDSPTYAGLSGSAIYGLGEVAGQNSAGQALGAGGQYVTGSLAVFAGYYQSKLGAAATDISSDTSTLVPGVGKAGDTALRVVNLGTSYQAGPARLYGNWSLVKQPLALFSAIPISGILPAGYAIGGANNNKANIYELGVNYAISGPLNLLASIQRSVLDYTGNALPTGKLTQINLGTRYFLSKRTDLYAVVSNQGAKNTYAPGVVSSAAGLEGNQTFATVGIRHRF